MGPFGLCGHRGLLLLPGVNTMLNGVYGWENGGILDLKTIEKPLKVVGLVQFGSGLERDTIFCMGGLMEFMDLSGMPKNRVDRV